MILKKIKGANEMKKAVKIIIAAALAALLSGCGAKLELTDEIIFGLIDSDLQITKFLYYEPPACDYSDPEELDGTTYYRVADEKFDDWNEWEEYVFSAYCGELAEAALSTDTLVCIDGKTYSDGGGRGYDLSDNYVYEITSQDAETAVILMYNSSADPDEDYSTKTAYSLRLTGDGWRIESK